MCCRWNLTPAAEAGEALGAPLTVSVWLEPYQETRDHNDPDARLEHRENIELAFVAAELVDATVPAVNSALQRARRIVNDHIQSQGAYQNARSMGDTRLVRGRLVRVRIIARAWSGSLRRGSRRAPGRRW